MLSKEPGPTASIEENGVDLKFAPSTLILAYGGNARWQWIITYLRILRILHGRYRWPYNLAFSS